MASNYLLEFYNNKNFKIFLNEILVWEATIPIHDQLREVAIIRINNNYVSQLNNILLEDKFTNNGFSEMATTPHSSKDKSSFSIETVFVNMFAKF